MYLPTSSPATFLDILSTFGPGNLKDKNGGWSSLIGVVTAICGNILISFALNTQRYAHIRLSRDREAALEEKKKAARRRLSPRNSYGTQQAVAEERAKQNAKSESNGYILEREGAAETQPLIPKQDSKSISGTPGNAAGHEEDDDEQTKEKSYLRSPIWWVGIILMVIGETGNFLAYGFAPASIVSPLGVVALISNCLIAPLLLGEHFRWRDALGVIIAVGGCVVVVLSASSNNPKLSPESIWSLVTTWEFETYLGITIFLIVVLMFLSNKYGQKSILIDLGLVGLFGGYTALSTKGVVSLLTYSIWRVVTFPITYLLVFVLVLTAVMQIKYVNRALQRFNSTMVIPTQFVMFTLSVIIGSAVLYRDFEREETDDAIKFVSGCALTFFGVWCITSGQKQDSNDDEDDEPGDEEDAISLVDEEGGIPEIRENDEPPARQASTAAGSSYSIPALHRYPTADAGSLPKSLKTPVMQPALGTTPTSDIKPLQEQLANLQPADASAIRAETAAPLHGGTDSTRRQKPPIHATTSEPLVPTTPHFSSSLRPKTPLTRTPSGPAAESPSKRPPAQHSQTLDPNTSARLLKRQSVAGLFPGPLTSPLSGSLSAIVADELRRGVDKSPLGSIRRKGMTRAAQATQRLAGPTAGSSNLKRHSIASCEMDFDDSEEARIAAGSPPEGKRMRSLSATLGEMFSSGSGSLKRQRTAESAAIVEEDEESTERRR